MKNAKEIIKESIATEKRINAIRGMESEDFCKLNDLEVIAIENELNTLCKRMEYLTNIIEKF